MDVITRAARVFGNSPMLRMAGKALSFIECDKQAQEIAKNLCDKGLCAGNIVAVVAPNSLEEVLLLLGLLKAGMIAAPLNNRFPEHRLSNTINKLQPNLIATSSKTTLPGSISIVELLNNNSLGTAFYRATSTRTVPANNTSVAMPDMEESIAAMERSVTIIHTSASSGEAKAAVHSFANHWYNARGSNENLPFGPGDCWLLSLPLYHIGGYALLFRSLISGGALAIPGHDETLGRSLFNFPLTHLSLVPTQLYRLLADQQSTARLRKLKAVLLGGSSAPKSLIEDALQKEIPIYLSYGSTEMGSQIATTPEPISRVQQNSGIILSYRELAVAKDGELLVKGPCLFQGYLQGGVIQPQTDNEGWFHTSDIGSVSNNNTVTVLGRKDNMFISGGENIHPEEIEKALMMIEGILEALVVPVADKEYGQRPVAFIQTDEGKITDESAIMEAMHAMVGTLKSPTRYFRIDEWATLPGSQKIDRAWYRKEVSAPGSLAFEP